MNIEKVIVLLSIIVIYLIVLNLVSKSNETFSQLDICDFDSPDPSQFCKSIQKGCTDLIHDGKTISKNINDNCTTLPTNTKDLINTAINCDDASNKKIMNEYVQKEVCSQIKNFPVPAPEPEVLPPASFVPFEPEITVLAYDGNEDIYAPF